MRGSAVRPIKLGYTSGETVANNQLPVRRYRTAANALGGKGLWCATVNVLNETANPMSRQVPGKHDLLAIGHPVDHVAIALDPPLSIRLTVPAPVGRSMSCE